LLARHSVWLLGRMPGLCNLAPAADGGSQLKEMVSCESGPSALSEDANVPLLRWSFGTLP
jgi:hypothetical protein